MAERRIRFEFPAALDSALHFRPSKPSFPPINTRHILSRGGAALLTLTPFLAHGAAQTITAAGIPLIQTGAYAVALPSAGAGTAFTLTVQLGANGSMNAGG